MSAIRTAELCAIGEHDVGDPIFEDDALFGVQAVELETHAEGGVGVDDLGFRVEGALVAEILIATGVPMPKGVSAST